MTIELIVDRLIDGVLRLYYRQWMMWELLTLGLAVLGLLAMVVRAYLKTAANEKRMRENAAGIHT